MTRLSFVILTLLALCFASQVTLGGAVPKSPKLDLKSSPHLNPTSKFCKKFVKACYDVALEGKTGHVTVTHECERHGKKHSHSYSFGCKADKKDITKRVLNKIGQGSVATSAMRSVKTSPVTATSPTTKTTTRTHTTTSTTTAAIPVVEIVVDPPITRKRSKSADTVDKSAFCSAFSNGCESRCLTLKSAPKHVECHSKCKNHYSLACQCESGKMETQHALYAAAGKEHIKEVSTVSISYKTVATVRPVHTVTKDVITTVRATATSTTQIVLAQTGAVQVFSAKEESEESSLGYLRDVEDLTVDKELDNAVIYMAVQDPKSKLYQLQVYGFPDNKLLIIGITGGEGSQEGDFTQKTSYAYAYDLPSDLFCGDNANQAGEPSGQYYCEDFVFGFSGDQLSLQRDHTANLTMQWYNKGDKASKEYSWFLDAYKYFGAAADVKSAQPSGKPATQVYLRYPIQLQK